MPIPADVSTVNIDSDQDDPRLWRADGLDHMEKFNELLSYLRTVAVSPLHYNAVGDGETDDTAAFTALEAAHSGLTIDLLGKTYLVDAVPTGNRYRNGYFKVAGYLGDADVLFPQADTLLTAVMPLTDGAANCGWPQDKWHVWNQQLWAIWTESTSHGLSEGDGRMVTMRSLDGLNFGCRDQFKPTAASTSAWAAGCIGGVQVAALREDANGIFRLYARRLPQRVELTDVIRTTSGEDYFYILHEDIDVPEGMTFVEGQTAIFTSVDPVGGLTISGEYQVELVNDERIRFTRTGMPAASSTAVGGGEFAILIPESGWQTIAIGGVSLGAAIASFGGSPFSGAPTVIQSVAWAPGGDGKAGTFYCGASGNGGNAAIVKVSNAFDVNGNTIANVQEITGADADITEPTVICLSDGRLCGFARTQDANPGQAVPAIFWTSTDDLQTFTVTDLPLGVFEMSPISLCECGDKIVAVASLRRDGDGQKGYREIVLLVADKEAAFADGASAFEIIWIESAWNANAAFGNIATSGGGVGVPSIAAIDDKTVFLGFNSEREFLDPVRPLTKVDIVAMKIGLGSANPVDYKGAARVAFGQVEGLGAWSGSVYGLPAVSNGGYLTFETIQEMDAPWSIDVSGTDGYFTPPMPGVYEFSLQVCYAGGSVGERYVQLVDENDAVINGLILAGSSAHNTTNSSYGASTFSVPLRAGQKVRFKLSAANGTVDSVARSFLSIRRLV